jgi:hypothetical protein
MGAVRGGGTLCSANEEVEGMAEETTEGVLQHNAHKVAVGGPVVAVLSILALVPVVRRLRERRQRKSAPEILFVVPLLRRVRTQRHHHRRHFPSFGH